MTSTDSTTNESPTAERQRYIAEYVPAMFRDCTFSNYVPTTDQQGQIANYLRDWAGDPNFLLLAGGPGTGKSHLLVSKFYADLDKDDWWPFFMPERKLVQYWRDIHQHPDEWAQSPDDFVDVLATHKGLLILDDIGSTRLTDNAYSMLFTIIDTRYSEQLPTLMSTNHQLGTLATIVGDRMVSRMASGRKLWLDGADWRLRSPT